MPEFIGPCFLKKSSSNRELEERNGQLPLGINLPFHCRGAIKRLFWQNTESCFLSGLKDMSDMNLQCVHAVELGVQISV